MIGCTGKSGLTAYKKAWVNPRKLFDFIYTPLDSSSHDRIIHGDKVHFTFVGQLIERKCVVEMIRVFLSLPDDSFHLNIIGSGSLTETVRVIIQGHDNISFYDFLSREDIGKILCATDVLVLPSSFDGWGTTVNEGMMKGCRVLVSDGCGSHSLIKGNSRLGSCFKANNWKEFKDCISADIRRGPQTAIQKDYIASWSNRIQSKKAAVFLLDSINFHLLGYGSVPPTPWYSNF